MKKIYLLIVGVSFGSLVSAQSFSDDFESYTAGSYLGASSSEWTTWSGTTGGGEDAMVVTTQANSGTNSIYFASTSQGPQDVVLPFGNAYTQGHFEYEMMMYLTSGTDAYFNFQAEQTIGTTWALDVYLSGNGSFQMSNQGGSLLSGNFPTGQWFKLAFDINLNLNEWTVLIDNVEAGSFANTVNQIASIDIFPLLISGSGSTNSEFWIDDVAYNYETITLAGLDAAVTSITGLNGLVTQDKRPTVTVKNLGTTNLTSFDVTVNYNGSSFTENITGVNIASLQDLEIELGSTLELAAGPLDVTATVSNVNGNTSDDDATNDTKTLSLDPVEPALHKRVLVEEATGTWCQWCPRGAVWMAIMEERYPDHFVGVAVHNGDPMTVAVYDDGIGNYIGGYPSSIVDRGADIDPSAMEPDFIERVQEAPAGILCESINYVAGASTMELTLQVVLLENITSDWKVAFVVTEDSVTGTGSGYNQSNAYAGGGSGELIGAGLEWHNEPSSVPASKMVYNHVGRAIAPSFEGMNNSFPSGGSVGDTFSFTTTITIGTDWDLDQVHVAGVLFAPDGRADNAIKYSFDEALDRQCALDPLGAKEIEALVLPTLQVFPNPASSQIAVRISENTANNATLQLRDLLGKVIMQTTVRNNTGINDVILDISSLNSGIYMLELINGNSIESTKFIKQ
ncbi:MAG: T9SS type A sorting domain-containing protein [Salibacteraceae bacterium]|nr:T9SS type A sorting domain-containing protein [Salibacteraceae bacterium]